MTESRRYITPLLKRAWSTLKTMLSSAVRPVKPFSVSLLRSNLVTYTCTFFNFGLQPVNVSDSASAKKEETLNIFFIFHLDKKKGGHVPALGSIPLCGI